MKKFLGAVVATVLISNSAAAMQFSQPEKLGMVTWSQVRANGYIFDGETSNKGTKKSSGSNYNIYSKGVAKYGNGEDALYIHYDDSHSTFCNLGSKDISNTQKVGLFCDVIYKITTNKGITLYPINYIYGPAGSYTIIGRQKDGKWVKYIDTDEIAKQYLGLNSLTGGEMIFFLSSQGDTLVMKYRPNRSRYDIGEFRFKWDDAAQWFSVEQIKY